jgi:hypothetical protein
MMGTIESTGAFVRVSARTRAWKRKLLQLPYGFFAGVFAALNPVNRRQCYRPG